MQFLQDRKQAEDMTQTLCSESKTQALTSVIESLLVSSLTGNRYIVFCFKLRKKLQIFNEIIIVRLFFCCIRNK